MISTYKILQSFVLIGGSFENRLFTKASILGTKGEYTMNPDEVN